MGASFLTGWCTLGAGDLLKPGCPPTTPLAFHHSPCTALLPHSACHSPSSSLQPSQASIRRSTTSTSSVASRVISDRRSPQMPDSMQALRRRRGGEASRRMGAHVVGCLQHDSCPALPLP